MSPLHRHRRGPLPSEFAALGKDTTALISTPPQPSDEVECLTSEITTLRAKLAVASQAVDDLKWLDSWKTIEIHRTAELNWVHLYYRPVLGDITDPSRNGSGPDLLAAIAAARTREATLRAQLPYRSPSRLDQSPRNLDRDSSSSS